MPVGTCPGKTWPVGVACHAACVQSPRHRCAASPPHNGRRGRSACHVTHIVRSFAGAPTPKRIRGKRTAHTCRASSLRDALSKSHNVALHAMSGLCEGQCRASHPQPDSRGVPIPARRPTAARVEAMTQELPALRAIGDSRHDHTGHRGRGRLLAHKAVALPGANVHKLSYAQATA